MAEEEAGTSGEPTRPESQIQQPRDKSVPARHARKRSPRSVLQVSQLLLRAIAAHKGLTLPALKKELGSAGYEVRRKSHNPSGDPARADPKGALLRVSGGSAAGCFRVWKVPKSKRKQRGATRAEEGSRAGKKTPRTPRTPARTRSPQRPGATKQQQLQQQQLQQCRVTRKGREALGSSRANARRPGVKSSRQPRRSRAEKTRRAQPSKEVDGSRTRESKRSTNARGEKEEEEQQPAPPESENLATGQAKMYDLRVTRSKTSTKSESARTASKSP